MQLDVVVYLIPYAEEFYGSSFHVAAILKRNTTFEYIDSMASSHVHNACAQRVLELTFRLMICKQHSYTYIGYGVEPARNHCVVICMYCIFIIISS